MKTVLFVLMFMGIGVNAFASELSTPIQNKTAVLEGSTWKLVSFGMSRMAVQDNATISFKDGHYSGRGGCNGIGGNYELKGERLSLSAGFSTMMACPELDLEHKYNQALQAVTQWSISNNTLDLRSDKQSLLRFQAK